MKISSRFRYCGTIEHLVYRKFRASVADLMHHHMINWDWHIINLYMAETGVNRLL